MLENWLKIWLFENYFVPLHHKVQQPLLHGIHVEGARD
jgi:hypothetical protein